MKARTVTCNQGREIKTVFKLLLLVLVIAAMFMAYQKINEKYTLDGYVSSVCGDLITVSTERGNWSFYGDGFSKYDHVEMVINGNHTNGYADDSVEDAYKLR